MKTTQKTILGILSVLSGMPMLAQTPPVTSPDVWLKGDAGIVLDSGGKVERWEDQSGNGNHFEQTTEAKRPEIVADGFLPGRGDLTKFTRAQYGGSNWGGSMGLDFVVEEEVRVTHLAAFDHLRDGFTGSITVQLWQREENGTVNQTGDDSGSVILETLTFDALEPGVLEGVWRWKLLGVPRTLAPGSYTLVSWGYTGSDRYYSSPNTGKGPTDPALRWVGTSRYSNNNEPGVFPQFVHSTYADYYAGALNLRFEATARLEASQAAVVFDGVDDGLEGVAGLLVERPSTVFVAYERYADEFGYILQNSSGTGGNWWFRADGYYADGWVRNRTVDWRRPHVAAMLSTETGTRAYEDLSEMTEYEAHTTPRPGRLAMGGGSGQQIDAVPVKVAELLVYKRELSESEIYQTQAYLAKKYGFFTAPLENPSIAPAGHVGTGSVTVTITSGVVGSEIRYTTDGTEPMESSTLYTGSFSVARGTEVRARAFKVGEVESGVASQYYGDSNLSELPVGGALMWLDAERGLETDGEGRVSRWRDLTGNGNDVLQRMISSRPLVAEGMPRDGGIAIETRYGSSGTSTYAGTLGTDFEVDEAVEVTHLGAFDHLADGFAGTIVVQLWSRDDQSTKKTPEDDEAGSLLAEAEFTNVQPGELDGTQGNSGYRFKSLASPITLNPGSYTILAWGYVGADLYRNSNDGFWLPEGLRFVNNSRFVNSTGAWPTNIDSHPVKFNGAGNFQYRRVGKTPSRSKVVHFDGSDDGLLAAATSNLPRPSTIYIVCEQLEANGIMMQNTSNGWWFMRNDGFYSDGWIRNQNLPVREPMTVAMVNGPVQTRAYLNGEDWSLNPNVSARGPGRLALGGGVGTSFDPSNVQIAEVIAFDRELSEVERWQVEKYLANKHAVPMSELPAVVISPASSVGSGSVEVMMSNVVPGAEIRYTTDGSEPTEGSSLYVGDVTVARGVKVRARAFLTGVLPSVISEVCYEESGELGDLPVLGAKMWLRSDCGVALDQDGGVVRWSDLTGNGNDVYQGLVSKRPRLVDAGLTGIKESAIVVQEGDGNRIYAGTLGEDFVVEGELMVTHLGAFDHRSDGFAGTITVQLWSRDDKGTEATQSDDSAGEMLAQMTFDSANPGELEGSLRFRELPAAVRLAPGAYTVLAWGYTGEDRFLAGLRSKENGDERFRFVGASRFGSTAGNFPSISDNGSLYYNGAANFKVSPLMASEDVPALVFDGKDDGLRGVEGMDFTRPSTVLMAFQWDGEEGGYALQNSGVGNWWFSRDGFYSDGWVAYEVRENFATGVPHLGVMVNGNGFTRAYRNGDDVSTVLTRTSPAPGRLALGGGEGQQNDPAKVRISELIVFDRVLDDGELWVMQNYMAARNRIIDIEVVPPLVAPSSNYGVGDVEVALSSISPGAEIRYTTDGREPDGTSALYSAPFIVSRETTVRAVAFLNGRQSGVAEAFYGDSSSHPLPVTDVAMWLRSDSGVETRPDGGVSRWRDLSGNGRDVLQILSAKSPSYVEDAFGGSLREAVLVPFGSTGGTNYGGTVGTDFIVDEEIELTEIGAFDHNSDGFAGTVTVTLHRVNDNDTPAVANDDSSAEMILTQVFSNASPGVLDGGTRYIELSSPITLAPGRYFLASTGWNGADSYRNAEVWEQIEGEGVSYPNVSRYSISSIFPGTLVYDSRYLGEAANFKFRKMGAMASTYPAVRFDGVDDGMLGDLNYEVGRPSTVFMVFNQLGGADGRLIQSSSGQNWFLGPHNVDGFYANGYVSQHKIRRNVPSLVIGAQDVNDSRYYYNGQDLTQDRNPTGLLGRVALGGGEGNNFQPCNADLVELIIYDRVLTELERQQVAAALNERYDLPLEAIQPPAISPDGGLYASSKVVSLSHPQAGVEIRYTRNGDEPDETSTLYTGTFEVMANEVVKARAYAMGYLPSVVEEAEFIIDSLAITPPQRDAMQLWLRAEVGVQEESGAVALWRDLSGSGQDAFQNTAASRPTVTSSAIGGKPGITFDGNDDTLSLPEGFADFTQGLTAMFVVRPNAVAAWQRFLDLSRGTTDRSITFGRYGSSAEFDYTARTYYSDVRAPSAIQQLSNQIITVSHQTDGVVKIFQNGSLLTEATGRALPFNDVRWINRIGRSNWTTGFYSGEIGEIILFNRTLDDLERETLELAVRANYGIASTATGTVAYSPAPGQLYPSGVSVTLSSVTPDAMIYYTTDGSVPDETDTLYTGPLNITSSTRLRARAFAVGFNASQFSEATYLVGIPPASGDGLRATYYNEEDFTGSTLTRVDSTVDFSWGQPDPSIDSTSFSVRWTGKVMPRFSEDYTFSTASDDGQRLWLDLNRDGDFDDAGEFLIDDWTLHTERERVATPVPLTAGLLYDIKMEMFQGSAGGSAARLRWSSFSEPKQIIPQSQLFSNAEFNQTVSTPVISPASGTFTAAVDVSISTATSGATIYYTVDGSEPTQASLIYSEPFSIGVSGFVKAKAYRTGLNPSGIATRSYTIDAQPPVITAFQWDGADLPNGRVLTAKGVVSTTAADSQGVASAEFYYQSSGSVRVLIGRDISTSDGLSAIWDVSTIPDGNYNLITRVFDTAGTFAEESRSVTVDLATWPAPFISQPATDLTVENPTIQLRIDSVPSANIRISRDGQLLFAGYADTNGRFLYNAPLQTGANSFQAVARNRAGDSPLSNTVVVTREREFPQLVIDFGGENTLVEGMSLLGVVRIPAPQATDLTVQINTDKPSQIELLPPVVIPAGQVQGTFNLGGSQDVLVELPTNVRVEAVAPLYRSASTIIMLGDDDLPTLAFDLPRLNVSESDGVIFATLTREPVLPIAQNVVLFNSNNTSVQMPSNITIPAFQSSVEIPVTILDNTIADGDRTATLSAQVFVGGSVASSSPSRTLTIGDDEGPSLELAYPPAFVLEGEAVNLVLRNVGGPVSSDLNVTLAANPVGLLNVPAQVTILSGQQEVFVPVNSTDNGIAEGKRNLVIAASATGYSPSVLNLLLTDEPLPDLQVADVGAPSSVRSESQFQVNYRIENNGAADANSAFLSRVYLSKDNVLDDADALVNQYQFPGGLSGGLYFERNETIFAPRANGSYFIIITTDSLRQIPELFETNNMRVMTTPVEVVPEYTATVSASQEVYNVNQAVTFTGNATLAGGGAASFKLVNIHIRSGNVERVISALTNSAGQFTTTWNALSGEGGDFEVGAVHPGLAAAPAQDTFSILAISPSGFPTNRLVFDEGSGSQFTGKLTNPSSLQLTGLTANVPDLPAGLRVNINLSGTTLAGLGTLNLDVDVQADAGFTSTGRFVIEITSDQGVTLRVPIDITVRALEPSLVVEPGNIRCSVLRGGQKTASIKITNAGGRETGPIDVALPSLSFLSLATISPLPSLQPGEETVISLQISPSATDALTQYTGNIAINPANGQGRAVPFTIRVVSDLLGDLEIEAVDEYFFYTEAKPKLQGATVVVSDAISGQEVRRMDTPESGVLLFEDLSEGWYVVDVTALQHDSWRGNVYVEAEEVTKQQTFLSRQTVTYTWTVEETEIEDRYEITVETVFETNVPAPVITVTPSSLNLSDLTALGQTKIVDMTVENHGLIAAQNGAFEFSSHPFYEIIPLIPDVGTIPAKSSITVPVTIRRIGEFDGEGNVRTLNKSLEKYYKANKSASVSCFMGGALRAEYECGPNKQGIGVPIPINGVVGNCSSGRGGSGSRYNFRGEVFGQFGGYGGAGGSVGTGLGNVSFTLPEVCCPFSELCLGGELSVSVPGVLSKVASGITKALPSGARLEGFSATSSVSGKVCICCKDGKFDTSRETEVKLELKGEVQFGPPTPDLSLPGGTGLVLEKAELDADIGVSIELGGSIAISSKKECFGETKNCVTGTAFTKVFAGAKITAEVIAAEPATSKRFSGKIEGKLGVEGALEAKFEWCDGQPGKFQACAKMDAIATLEGSISEIQVGAGGANGASSGVKFLSLGAKTELVNQCVPAPSPGSKRLQNGDKAEPVDPFEGLGYEPIDFTDAFPTDEELLQTPEAQEILAGAEGGGVCAQVKLKLSQELAMTRTAFLATLELGNNVQEQDLTGVGFDLDIRDELGNPANDLFNIRVTKFIGIDAIDGTGVVKGGSAGTIQWTLIPRDTSALEADTRYTIGGTIRYTQNGLDLNIPVDPAPITVRPDASLYLKYFHQRDVISDDPFTDQIEPARPYSLAVQICNQGAGAARNLRITSAQPEIVDNEKGLLIDFKIIASELAGQPLMPSLTINFGDIAPGEKKIGTWLLTSSLQGLFTDYKATFEHIDGLGDPRISLLQEVEIHEMIRMIEALGEKADGQPDFLTNDLPDLNDFPDTVHLSDGTTEQVLLVQSAQVTGSGDTFQVSVPASEDWMYVRIPDPSNGTRQLTSVTRSDGLVIPLDKNTWTSDRTFIGLGFRPRLENIFHLADCDSTGIYTLRYGEPPTADEVAPETMIAAMPASSGEEIFVRWTGTDNDSGIAGYDILVSVDGGPYLPWQTNTRLTSAIYRGTLGTDYAFYSIGIDRQGNREPAPTVPDAFTSVTESNEAPIIQPIPNQVVDESEVFNYRVVASDPDGPSSGLSYSVISSTPGLVINSNTGELRWVTGENNGGAVLPVTILVTDNGVPQRATTTDFNITVVEKNRPPLLTPVPPQTLEAGGVMLIDFEASDPDVPVQNVSFSLGSGAPVGMRIDEETGVLTWTPGQTFNDTTHIVEVIAQDNGSPTKSTSVTLSVKVNAETGTAPSLEDIPVVLWLQGKSFSMRFNASEPDGDRVNIAADITGLTGASFSNLSSGIGDFQWSTGTNEPRVYRIPVVASDPDGFDTKDLVVRLVEDNLYWRWAGDEFGTEFSSEAQLPTLEPDADPDGDLRTNVHEMALLTNPQNPDSVALNIDIDDSIAPFRAIKLTLHRRNGSEDFVRISPERKLDLLKAWERVPLAEWSSAVDLEGDDDNDPETELLNLFIYEYNPAGNPEHQFFRAISEENE